jgi:hypothetical protein
MGHDADFLAGLSERSVSGEYRATLECSDSQVYGIESLQRHGEAHQPFAGLREMETLDWKPDVKPLLQVRLKRCEHAARVGTAYLARPNFAGEGGGQFYLGKPANGALVLMSKCSLRRVAQGFGTVVRNQNAGVDVNQ